MNDIEELQKIFTEIGNPAVAILKTPLAGTEVENGYGMDFDLPQYAVIHEGNFFSNHEGNERYYDWERERYQRGKDITTMKFSVDRCKPNVGSLLQELHDRDGYEVVWRKQ